MQTADATIEPNVWRIGSFCIEGLFLSFAKIPLKTPDEAKHTQRLCHVFMQMIS